MLHLHRRTAKRWASRLLRAKDSCIGLNYCSIRKFEEDYKRLVKIGIFFLEIELAKSM